MLGDYYIKYYSISKIPNTTFVIKVHREISFFS